MLGGQDSVSPLQQELQCSRLRIESSARSRELDHPGVFPGRLRSSRFARRDGSNFESRGFREVLAVAVNQRHSQECGKRKNSIHVPDYKMRAPLLRSRNAKLRQEWLSCLTHLD